LFLALFTICLHDSAKRLMGLSPNILTFDKRKE
jgi:hypothetical protein